MKFKTTFKHIGVAAAVLGLGAGLTIPGTGCGSQQASRLDTPGGDVTVTSRPSLPLLDLEAPDSYQTASFAYG